jgi:hypothetical protein
MKTSLKILLPAVVIALGFAACKPTSTGVFTVVTEKVAIDTIAQPEVIGAIDVRVDLQMIRSDSSSMVLTLPLPGKAAIDLIRKRLDVFEKGRSAWYGVVDKDPGSFVLISITNNAIAGNITTSRGAIYTITCVGKELHRVSELDSRKFKESPDDYIVPDIKEPEHPAPGDCPDPPNNIDVMVVYTAAAETGAGGTDGMIALIYECIYLSNLAYQNSNINQRLNLVHFEQVTYTESGAGGTDLPRLQNPSDGFMDNVPTLRDTYGADLVCLLVETFDYNGIAYVMSTVSNSFAPYGYSVVRRSNSAASLTFPHELGHNMGARHDCPTDATLGSPYDYNHGFFVSNPADGGNSWRTVMAYNACGTAPCTRIPYFSNPNLAYSPTGSAITDPMGTAASPGTCTADNHLTLNNTAGTVANFRCSSPGVTNVWMRDTWNDTGLEPDPNTASEAMWRSPYIWVRNDQDPTFLHQYEHQDPITGQTNWVYVKMINGGATAASGTLEVYYANASVSLNWFTGWTLFGSKAVTLDANSNAVVEIEWNSLPGTGHYCLVARWNAASDPMTFAETADIGYNVRQNNNIIWRNVNIIALSPDMDRIEAVFEMKNPGGQPTMLQFSDNAIFPKQAFVETGEVFIVLDGRLYEQWQKGGSKGTGIKVDQGMIRMTDRSATLENIMMGRKDMGKVTIRFNRTKETIPDKYIFNVTQYAPGVDREKKPLNRAIGGVSYEIYTYKR